MGESTFREWIQGYTPDVYQYFLCNLRLEEELAEELTHQTFVAVWTSMSSFEGRSSPKTWILGIARNIAKKNFRNLKRARMSPEVFQSMKAETSVWRSEEQNPEILLRKKREQELLSSIIERLPEKKREVFRLRYQQQMTIDELAEFCQEPRETIRSRLRAARDEVKITWQESMKNQ